MILESSKITQVANQCSSCVTQHVKKKYELYSASWPACFDWSQRFNSSPQTIIACTKIMCRTCASSHGMFNSGTMNTLYHLFPGKVWQINPSMPQINVFWWSLTVLQKCQNAIMAHTLLQIASTKICAVLLHLFPWSYIMLNSRPKWSPCKQYDWSCYITYVNSCVTPHVACQQPRMQQMIYVLFQRSYFDFCVYHVLYSDIDPELPPQISVMFPGHGTLQESAIPYLIGPVILSKLPVCSLWSSPLLCKTNQNIDRSNCAKTMKIIQSKPSVEFFKWW